MTSSSRAWDVKTGKVLVDHAVRPPGVAIPDDDDPAPGGMRMMEMMMGPATFTPDGQRMVFAPGRKLPRHRRGHRPG